MIGQRIRWRVHVWTWLIAKTVHHLAGTGRGHDTWTYLQNNQSSASAKWVNGNGFFEQWTRSRMWRLTSGSHSSPSLITQNMWCTSMSTCGKPSTDGGQTLFSSYWLSASSAVVVTGPWNPPSAAQVVCSALVFNFQCHALNWLTGWLTAGHVNDNDKAVKVCQSMSMTCQWFQSSCCKALLHGVSEAFHHPCCRIIDIWQISQLHVRLCGQQVFSNQRKVKIQLQIES